MVKDQVDCYLTDECLLKQIHNWFLFRSETKNNVTRQNRSLVLKGHRSYVFKDFLHLQTNSDLLFLAIKRIATVLSNTIGTCFMDIP